MTIRFGPPLTPSTNQFGVNSLGIVGSSIPSSGTYGPSIVFKHLNLPTENSDEFRVKNTTSPVGLTLFRINEDGSLDITGPDGIYNGTYEWFKNGISSGFGGFVVVLGAPVSGMLRDLNQSFGGKRLLTTPQVGILGSAIPSTGTNGPGFIYDDLDLPADNNKLYRGFITAFPSAGTLIANDDSSFTFSGAPNGIYSFTYDLYENDVNLGSTTEELGVGTGAIGGDITLDDETTAMSAITGNSLGIISFNLEDAVFSGSAQQAPITAQISITLDNSVFAGSANPSPETAFNITLSDAVYLGPAGVGGATVLGVILDEDVFTGSASGSVGTGGTAGLDVLLEEAIFTGSAVANENTQSDATIGAITDSTIFTGSAQPSSNSDGTAVFGVITDDILASASAVGFTGSGTVSSAVIGITLEDTIFLGSYTGSSQALVDINASTDDVSVSIYAVSSSTTASINATLADVSTNISVTSATAVGGISITTDSVIFAGSAQNIEAVPAVIDITTDDVDVFWSAIGSTPPSSVGPTSRLPISLGITLDGKLIILL